MVDQTIKRFFVTLVVDGDETFPKDEIEKEFSDKLHLNIIMNKENRGPGYSRQMGINNTTCEYLIFLDSDDMLFPYAVELLSREAQKNNADIVTSPFIQHEHTSNYDIKDTDDNIVWVHGKIYKREFLVENNITFPYLMSNEDAAFNTYAFNMTKNIYKIPIPTMVWIDNKDSITRSDSNFYVKCLSGWIIGQTWAFIQILNHGKVDEFLYSRGVIYIYNYYQKLLFEKEYISQEVEDGIYAFLHHPEIEKLFKDPRFSILICQNAIDKSNSMGYFNCETVMQFLKRYDTEMVDAAGGVIQ